MSAIVSTFSHLITRTTGQWTQSETSLRSSGLPLIDDVTSGGFPEGAMTELFATHAGLGEVRLLLPVLSGFRHVTWVLRSTSVFEPYAPALADAGLDLNRQLFTVPATPDEAFWCAEQAAASGETEAVVAWLNPAPHGRDAAGLARLAMAARANGVTIFAIRPAGMICTPSPAQLRLQLTPGPEGMTHVRAIRRNTFLDSAREIDVRLSDLTPARRRDHREPIVQLSLDLFPVGDNVSLHPLSRA